MEKLCKRYNNQRLVAFSGSPACLGKLYLLGFPAKASWPALVWDLDVLVSWGHRDSLRQTWVSPASATLCGMWKWAVALEVKLKEIILSIEINSAKMSHCPVCTLASYAKNCWERKPSTWKPGKKQAEGDTHTSPVLMEGLLCPTTAYMTNSPAH